VRRKTKSLSLRYKLYKLKDYYGSLQLENVFLGSSAILVCL
jgi:hypothetical protein